MAKRATQIPPLPESGVFGSTEEYLAWVAAGGAGGDGRNKFGAVPIVVDGVRFDSTGEADRWGDLEKLERAGVIANLRRQVAYDLHTPGGAVIGRIVLDYEYEEGGELVAEDFKGGKATMTALWRWKRKHFEGEYGRKIRVTER